MNQEFYLHIQAGKITIFQCRKKASRKWTDNIRIWKLLKTPTDL